MFYGDGRQFEHENIIPSSIRLMSTFYWIISERNWRRQEHTKGNGVGGCRDGWDGRQRECVRVRMEHKYKQINLIFPENCCRIKLCFPIFLLLVSFVIYSGRNVAVFIIFSSVFHLLFRILLM